MLVDRFQKTAVVEYDNNVPSNVLVSVCVMTYNHARFISDCLDSIIMQETDFAYEVIVGEDESSDGTRDICLRYAREYPEKIRLLLHSRDNVICVGGRPTGRFNTLFNISKAQGKYIAMCEGDDYWIDPLKLQKQVDFLEANPDYGLVHTDGDVFFVEENRIVHRNVSPQYNDQEHLFDLIIASRYPILTATVVFRADLYNEIKVSLNRIIGQFLMFDKAVWLEMSRLTKFYYIDEVTAVYRRLPKSLSHSTNAVKQALFELSSVEMRVYFVNKYRTRIPLYLKRRYNRALLLYKTMVPDYIDRYSLIRPNVVESFFYRVNHPSMRILVQLWFLLLFIKDHGIYLSIKKIIKLIMHLFVTNYYKI